MRIAYGVFGYGRGHATRALSVLPSLERQNDVLLMASGDAHAALSSAYRVYRLPEVGYVYGNSAKRSLVRTVTRNFGTGCDAVLGGPALNNVMRALRDFKPDVAICDCDPFAHHAAARLGIPRISFDHFGVLAFCKIPLPWADRVRALRDVAAYRLFVGFPERIIVSSFFGAPARRKGVTLVGALVRERVKRARVGSGDHLLCYFNNGAHQLTPQIEDALHALRMPVVIYGTNRNGSAGRLHFKAPCNKAFVDDLAHCVAVLSTAGNQLVGEALHLGKPMLVTPEDAVEQRVNAAAIQRMGFGHALRHDEIRDGTIRRFLANVPRYRENGKRYARDGTAEAVMTLLRFSSELLRERARRAPVRSVEFA